MRRLLFVITAAAMMSLTVDAAIYNLADDWSDTSNPNGIWSLYKNATALFVVNQADFYNNGSYQKAWADQVCFYNAHVPVWLKSNDDGRIYMHGAEFDRTGSNITFARWTSPENGTVTIDGSVWTTTLYNRTMSWALRYQGTVITGGTLYSNGSQGADNPFFFSAGSGGAGVLTFSVEAGQTIDLVFISASQGGNLGDMLGVDFTLNTTVPEPATMILLGLGGLLLRNRRNELSKM